MHEWAAVPAVGLFFAAACLGFFGPPARAAESALADLSLEELANIEITSVSRRAERLAEAAASVYVITAEAIRRSGASTLPQVLRLAPNLQVAQTDASQFAVTARGFNNAIGNKLLVLVDGRTIYTPFFSGVFWDQQDLLLADIERIEVISGPGATLWGANAVNGVINVITRRAEATQGLLLKAEAGTREAVVGVRHGGALSDQGHYRVYAKRTQRQNTQTENGARLGDGWTHQQVGFRADWATAVGDFTVQGDGYEGKSDARPISAIDFAAIEVSGFNLLGRWARQLEGGSNLRVQAYIDHTKRQDALLYRPTVDIADVEFQHTSQSTIHKVVWGGGHRRAKDNIQPGLFFGFHPSQKTMSWTNLFVQDEVQFGRTLELTLGAKLERNDYTGTESLPSAKLAWRAGTEHFVWAALSKAVRAPARLDHDISLPPNPPYFIAGGAGFESEVAKVAELGWRATPSAAFSISVTAFRHAWSRLRSGQLPPDAQVQNMIEGTTHGVEGWLTWQPTAVWRVSTGMTQLRQNLRVKAGSTDPTGPSALGNDPRHQWLVRLSVNPAAGHELDIAMRRVAALPDPAVPAYSALDLRYARQLTEGLTLAVIGRNLLDRRHAEFGVASGRGELARSVLWQLAWAL